jgi:hypothetical protein
LFDSKASIRFKSGAYTLVREYFKPIRNAAIEQKMRVYSQFKKKSSSILPKDLPSPQTEIEQKMRVYSQFKKKSSSILPKDLPSPQTETEWQVF